MMMTVQMANIRWSRRVSKYLGSVPHEPRLDHPVEGGLEDPEELLLGGCHLIVGKNDVIMIVTFTLFS